MPDHTRVQRVAHRGNAWGRRENTVAAFESAAAIGCDWLEVDVRTTRDSRVVVVHDATLARLWRHPAAVSDLDLHEVRSLGLTGTRIPLLEEVLDVAIATGTRVLIDVTNQRDGLNALALVRSYAPARELTVAYCGATDAMLAIREVAPDAALQYGHPGGLLADDVLVLTEMKASNGDMIGHELFRLRQVDIDELGRAVRRATGAKSGSRNRFCTRWRSPSWTGWATITRSWRKSDSRSRR